MLCGTAEVAKPSICSKGKITLEAFNNTTCRSQEICVMGPLVTMQQLKCHTRPLPPPPPPHAAPPPPPPPRGCT